MVETQALRLTVGTLHQTPFLHVVIPDCIDEGLAESLLIWFEKDAAWQPCGIADFYQHHDVDLKAATLPVDLKIFTTEVFLENLRQRMCELFNAKLDSRVDVTADRMLPGCRIGIHNDYGPVGHTHRLLIYLNRGWKADDGGLLMMFDEENPSLDSRNSKVYVPRHGRGIAFAISNCSFHAVSVIDSGERYALCFSFFEGQK